MPLRYDEASHTLRIGAREVDGTGAPGTRRFVVHQIDGERADRRGKVVEYGGQAMDVGMTRARE